MANEQFGFVTIICIIVILVLAAILFFYNSLNILGWINAWLTSNKEEKVGLTRLKGHYNANGYLVHSDSDIQLDWSSGSFKRFDSIDRDFKLSIATTSLNAALVPDHEEEEAQIPPQPLRPAPPIPINVFRSTSSDVRLQEKSAESSKSPGDTLTELSTTTSISPIPRPVSSVNVATLAAQSAFPVNLEPPPPSPGRNVSRTQSAPLKLSSVILQQQQQSHDKDKSIESTTSFDESDNVLKRALSCDSVCSDTSVGLGDLEGFNTTGYLCIGLEYDSENWDFIVNVLEAKDLSKVVRSDGYLDTYVRVSLLPDKEATIQTKIYRSSSSPNYKERFLFSLNPREQMQRSLCFQLYATDVTSHTLIGEGELRLADVSLRQPVTTWVTLTDTGQRGTEFGEIMFSLSYLPTAERLTVVVVKARNLKFQQNSMEVFVKVYLMQQNKKVNKKKTTTKKGERCPIFNEAMMFSVPAHTLNTIQMRLTVAELTNEETTKTTPIGHVIVGSQATGRYLSHWNQMLTTLRKPVAMWHSLRK
ncbi:synaptotagmin-12 [Anthonomus grandis grandis]|uniref:synaptotagmin-12 n=1 Tax=Anthonomus grandis grandis TaxID=2921223 RepID=UPI002165CDCC|nr:synaptotagmin-12 [Anthonomus grandis grandis]